MASSANLQTLARSLSDDERRYLHDRIVQSLSLTKSSQEQHLYRGEPPEEQRRALVRREIAEFSVVQRLWFAIRKFFSGLDDESLYQQMRVGRMKRKLRRGGKRFIDVDTRTVGPEFAEQVYELYRAAYPVIPIVKAAWGGSQMLRQIVEFHLRRSIPGAKYELEQFISLNDMMEIFRSNENKSDIRSEVLKRLKLYMDGIHEDVFRSIAEGVLPLYHLRGLGTFPFDEFFQLFSHTLDLSVPQETPSFDSAEFAVAGPYLEQLYYGLYLASKHGSRNALHEDVLRFYLLYEREGAEVLQSDDPQTLEHKTAAIDAAQVAGLQESIARLYEEAERALKEMPLVELVKTVHDDPYYRLMVYLPSLHLQEFYHAALKMHLLTELDELFPHVRLGVINKMIQELFGEEPPEFEFYRASIQQTVKKLGLPVFKHMRSLQVVYHFVREIYRPEIVELLRVLSRIVPVRVKEAGRDLLTIASGIEDAAEKMHLFDLGFSPDSDEGKSFYRLRYAVEKDLKQQRTYQKFVAQKDREARTLLDKSLDRFEELTTVFTNVRNASNNALNEKFTAVDGTAARGQRSLEAVLDRHLSRLHTLKAIVKQLIAVEEGS